MLPAFHIDQKGCPGKIEVRCLKLRVRGEECARHDVLHMKWLYYNQRRMLRSRPRLQ